MKRFYCTICQRVKRVRKYPASVVDSHNETVALRRGTCKWHDASFARKSTHESIPQITRAKRG